jgi:DNA polymerase bacteriophage-type
MIHTDFETYSEAELGGKMSVGIHNYAAHPSTRALMLAYAFDEEEPKLWFPDSEVIPADLATRLEDPHEEIAAWNSTFERYIFWYVLRIKLAIERFVDPQASARYLSLPGDLEDVGNILRLPADMQKDKEGERLIEMFSKPNKMRKKRGEEARTYQRTRETDPADWIKFGIYCKRDVIAEREIQRRLTLLKVFPLPERERRIWIRDQQINDRGIPTDLMFVKSAFKLATQEKKEALESQNKLTGLENANSRPQLLGWAQDHGYKKKTLKKETVAAELKFNTEMDPICRQVLEARKAASSTSYKKLSAILRQVSPDGRLRNQFIYMGSARCGRWSGNAVQLQNMARPTPEFEDEKVMTDARQMIYDEDYQKIRDRFGSVLTTVKSCLRTSFVVQPGRKFRVCDLNAIETRVGAWVSGCENLMNVFKEGHDPYLDYAMKMTQIPYEKLNADLHSKDPKIKAAAKLHRQIAKPVVLGCVYRLGGGGMGMKKGDPIKTGLWGYAENYGVEMTQKQAADNVKIFRDSYPEIPRFWYACEEAVKDVLKEGTVRVKREIGPNGCIKIDKVTLEDRDPILRIQLPSGRFIHYMDASIQSIKMPWKDSEEKDVYKPSLIYSGINQENHQWEVGVTSHGGKLMENIVQGIARDVIAEDLLICEDVGIEIDAHAHDELIGETEDTMFAPGLLDMAEIMGRPIPWLPGLLLAGDGFESDFYRKG